MTEAEMWVKENSQAKGAAWWFMLALAARAEGCVAISTAEQMVHEARISHRELYRVLSAQCQSGEIERLSEPRDPKPVRAFHFAKMNCANSWPVWGFQHQLCPCKQSTVPDLRKRTPYEWELVQRVAQNHFPQAVLQADLQLPLLPEIRKGMCRSGGQEPLWPLASTWQSESIFGPNAVLSPASSSIGKQGRPELNSSL